MNKPLLDTICQISTPKPLDWRYFTSSKKRRRRLWSRVNTGFEKFYTLRKPLYWMVLTSWDGAGHSRKHGSRNKSMTYSFKKLQQRLKRRGDFEYIKIHVKHEGEGGVLHIVYSGKYIEHSDLMREWYDIHGAFVVWIDRIRMTTTSIRKVVNYLVGYMNHHNDSQMSWSCGWLYKGAIQDMKIFIRDYGYRYGLVLYKRKVLITATKKVQQTGLETFF